jgi:serine/threonine-protein kinase
VNHLSLSDVPPELLEQFDGRWTAYEKAIQNGGNARLEAVLEGLAGPGYRVLLRHALRMEWELRQRLGQPVALRDYLHRFGDDDLVRAAFAEERTVPQVPGSKLQQGPRVPGYEIMEEVGRGGMGVVFKACQVKARRVVALKVRLPMGDKDRFRFEAKSMAQLRQSNIVQVFEVDDHDGEPYFSMEYADGGSLEKHLQGIPLSPREAAALVWRLARAVAVAHAANVVHRDLKPANILLFLPEDETAAESACLVRQKWYVPKVTDFGLAKKLDEPGPTVSGAVIGTYSYMAPEQARGEKAVGKLADVHALGAVLYECLTGRPPFRAAGIPEILLQVINDEPVSPRRLNTAIPRDLETICLKCLQKEPARRYASAAELGDDLSRFLAGKPIEGRPVGVLEKVWKWAQENPVAAGLLGYVGLLIAVLIQGSLWLAHEQGRRLEGEVCRSNRFAAAHVASTIERHLERMGEAARRLSADPKLRALWHQGEKAGWQEEDRKRLQPFFEQRRKSLNAAFRRGEAGGGGPFSSLTLLNGQGQLVVSSPFNREILGKDFSWRDFFRGGRDPGRGGTAQRFHVSRAFKSEIEPVYKLALSVPFCPDGAKPAGVVAATIAAGPTFGLQNLHDGRRNVALLAPEDTSRPRSAGPGLDEPLRYMVLLHPNIKEGDQPEWFPDEQLPGFDGAGGAESDTYRDPYHPGERWLAGFSGVGGTDLIVVVQQRHADAVAPYQSVLKHLWAWGVGAAAFPCVIWIISRQRRHPGQVHPAAVTP